MGEKTTEQASYALLLAIMPLFASVLDQAILANAGLFAQPQMILLPMGSLGVVGDEVTVFIVLSPQHDSIWMNLQHKPLFACSQSSSPSLHLCFCLPQPLPHI